MFFQRDVQDGMRTLWKLPVDVVSKSFLECVNPFKEFKTARANAQNLSYSLKVNEFTDIDNQ